MTDLRNVVAEEIKNSLQMLDVDKIEELAAAIDKADAIFCDGIGRSRMIMGTFAMRLRHMGFNSSLVGDASAPVFTKDSLLIIGTSSGSSDALLYHTKKAVALGGTVWLITSNRGSATSGYVDEILMVAAPDKKNIHHEAESVQPISTLFEQVLHITCDLVAMSLMERDQITESYMRMIHANLE